MLSVDDLVLGVDVSQYQRSIDWHALYADGVRFAYIKATQRKEDPVWRDHVAGAFDVGVKCTLYHFLDVGEGAPSIEEQIAVFAACYNSVSDWLAYPPVLDWEDFTKGGSFPTLEHARTAAKLIEKLTGRKPAIYCGDGYTRKVGALSCDELSRLPLIAASYPNKIDLESGFPYDGARPMVPPIWHGSTDFEVPVIWQYSNGSMHNKRTGGQFVDRNVATRGGLFALENFARLASVRAAGPSEIDLTNLARSSVEVASRSRVIDD